MASSFLGDRDGGGEDWANSEVESGTAQRSMIHARGERGWFMARVYTSTSPMGMAGTGEGMTIHGLAEIADFRQWGRLGG